MKAIISSTLQYFKQFSNYKAIEKIKKCASKIAAQKM